LYILSYSKFTSLNKIISIALALIFIVGSGLIAPKSLQSRVFASTGDSFQTFIIDAMSISSRSTLCTDVLANIKSETDVTQNMVTKAQTYLSDMSNSQINEALLIFADRSDSSKNIIITMIRIGMLFNSTSSINKFPNISNSFNSMITGDPGDNNGVFFLLTILYEARLQTGQSMATDGIPASKIVFRLDGHDADKEKVSSFISLLESLKGKISGCSGANNFDKLMSYIEGVINSQSDSEIAAFKSYIGDYGIYKKVVVSTPVPIVIPTATLPPLPVVTPSPVETATPLQDVQTPLPTNTPTATPTSLPTASNTPTATPTPPSTVPDTPTPLPTATNSLTPVPTIEPTPSPTADLSPTPVPTGSSDLPRFKDISQNFWAINEIEALASKGIIGGKDNSETFKPGDKVTRAEFTKILASALGIIDENATINYRDVPIGHWAYKFIASAVKAGIITGKPDGTFGSSETISRQDMAVMTARAFYKAYGKAEAPNTDSILKFSDRGSISGYAKKDIATAIKYGIITGKPGNIFDPKGTATRAEAAVVVYRLIYLY
jgi:hypothetical protein